MDGSDLPSCQGFGQPKGPLRPPATASAACKDEAEAETQAQIEATTAANGDGGERKKTASGPFGQNLNHTPRPGGRSTPDLTRVNSVSCFPR